MARCIRCGGGGAKRACPALGAGICPRCCAKHQRIDIECPDCAFLRQGGGKDGYRTGLNKLLRFAMDSEDRCREAFAQLGLPRRSVAEWEEPLVTAFVAYGYVDDNGERTIDVFLREFAPSLKIAEREALEALRQTGWPSLLEVQKVELDTGLHFKDLLTGETYFAREKSATHYLKKYDVVFGWLVQLGDHIELTGAGAGVPRIHVEFVREAMLQEAGRLRENSDAPEHELLLQALAVGQRALREAIENWRPPEMATIDGEDIVFCEAFFDVHDVDAAHAKLGEHPDFELDESGFLWFDREGRKSLGDGPLHLGWVYFTGERLKLETHSRERLERGKRLLGPYLEGLATHRVDSIKDLDVAMEEAKLRPGRALSEEIPAELQAQVIGPILQRHIDSWIDESIPALQGKTPRQAVKTKAGRAQVIAMLKDQENSMLRQPGGDTVEFDAVYRSLGLERS